MHNIIEMAILFILLIVMIGNLTSVIEYQIFTKGRWLRSSIGRALMTGWFGKFAFAGFIFLTRADLAFTGLTHDIIALCIYAPFAFTAVTWPVITWRANKTKKIFQEGE